MKKFAAVIAVMALCSAPVMAAEQGGFSGPSATQSQAGGFQGPNGSVTTVESAKSLRDDTWVTLRGNIVERISDISTCSKMPAVLSMLISITNAGTA